MRSRTEKDESGQNMAILHLGGAREHRREAPQMTTFDAARRRWTGNFKKLRFRV